MKRLFAVVLLAIGIIAATPSKNVEKIGSYTLTSTDKTQLDSISEKFEIVERNGDTFEIYVLEEQAEKFLKIAPSATLNTDDINSELRERFENKNEISGYRDIEEVYSYMEKLAADYPAIVSLEEYGKSQRGRTLYALKISDNVEINEDEPELMITSATHGDEVITVEVNLRLIDELVKGYGEDERLTAMVDEHELFFIPVVNPDGFANHSRYANGVDPNREYPWPDQPNRTPVECIANEMAFAAEHDFVGGMDFHASGEMVMYPWAYTYAAPRDNQIYSALANEMAEENGYEAGQISQVIYVAKGSSADYFYWKYNTVAFGIELARSKSPSSSEIPGVVDDAREMTWRFIENF
jgi:hypothetical protein